MKRVLTSLTLLAVAAVAIGVLSGATSPKHRTYLVRAIFDDASFAALGEDVRVAGAAVGSINALGVTSGKQAAVTLAITDPGFQPFRQNATCTIRPQSLIGEEYVDCNPGTVSAPALPRIRSGPGAGTYFLPVTHTSSPIDSDIVQNISSMPVRQSLALLIDELGTGLAARGSDLNAVIHRANPALGNTDKVLHILDAQDHTLAQLATNSDRVLAPLARVRRQISGFVVQANRTSVASATRAADIQRSFALFPSFLRQLRPLMANLGTLAQQGTPLMQSLGQSASSLGQQFANLTPFASAARTSLIKLGASAQASQGPLVGTLPLVQRLSHLGTQLEPAALNLDKLTASLNTTGGIEQLMKVLFNAALTGNGFNALGHYTRDEPLSSSCTNYATSPVPGCSADFANGGKAVASARILSTALKSASSQINQSSTLKGLMTYLVGN